jgi:lipid A ethanolaminephosphotransferase
LLFVAFYNDYNIKNIEIKWFISGLFFICLGLFILASLSHKILKLLIVFLLFFSTINFYIKNKYGYILDEIMIANALDSLGHINDAIDYKLWLYFLFFTIIPSIFIIKIKLLKTDYKIKFKIFLLVIILLSISIISLPNL